MQGTFDYICILGAWICSIGSIGRWYPCAFCNKRLVRHTGSLAASWHQPASSESRLEHSSDWQRHTIPEWPHHPEVPEGDHAGPNSGKQNAARRHGQPQWRLVQKSRSSAGLEGASPYIFRDYRNKTHAKERTLLLINTAMEIYYKKKTFEFIMIIP